MRIYTYIYDDCRARIRVPHNSARHDVVSIAVDLAFILKLLRKKSSSSHLPDNTNVSSIAENT